MAGQALQEGDAVWVDYPDVEDELHQGDSGRELVAGDRDLWREARWSWTSESDKSHEVFE